MMKKNPTMRVQEATAAWRLMGLVGNEENDDKKEETTLQQARWVMGLVVKRKTIKKEERNTPGKWKGPQQARWAMRGGWWMAGRT